MLDLLLGLTQVSEFASYLAQLDLDYYVENYVEKLDAYTV